MTFRLYVTVWLLFVTACFNRSDKSQGIQAIIIATPASVPADGATTATLTVIASADGTALPADAQVKLHSTDPNAVIKQPVGLNAAGVYVASISSTDVGGQTISGAVHRGDTVISLGTTASVTFVPGPVALARWRRA